jgi:hypothetical protein
MSEIVTHESVYNRRFLALLRNGASTNPTHVMKPNQHVCKCAHTDDDPPGEQRETYLSACCDLERDH